MLVLMVLSNLRWFKRLIMECNLLVFGADGVCLERFGVFVVGFGF